MFRFRAVFAVLRAIFVADVPLKLACLLLAALFWFYIDGQLADERDVVRRLAAAELPLPPGTQPVSEQSLPEVTVRVRGPRRLLAYVAPRDVQVNLKDVPLVRQRGPQPLAIARRHFQVEGLDVVNVTPTEVELNLAITSKRTLAVRPLTAGEVKPGFRLESVTAEPAEVPVSSAHDLDRATVALTEPIALQGLSESFETTVRVVKALSGDREAPVECARPVTVHVRIARQEPARVFDDLPVLGLAPADGAVLTPQTRALRVTVRGDANAVANLRPADIRLYVEWPAEWPLRGAAGRRFGPQRVQVKAIAPEGVKVHGEDGAELPAVSVTGQVAAPGP